MLSLNDCVFYFLAFSTLLSGIAVISSQNPIHSALFLAGSMLGIAALFMCLDAAFIAGVQIIVYAGAVMVLFVMVLMLFDIRGEEASVPRASLSSFLKLVSVGVLLGILAGAAYMSANTLLNPQSSDSPREPIKALAGTLFSNYLFEFELIGALLLMIAIGAVALSKIRGGTHSED